MLWDFVTAIYQTYGTDLSHSSTLSYIILFSWLRISLHTRIFFCPRQVTSSRPQCIWSVNLISSKLYTNVSEDGVIGVFLKWIRNSVNSASSGNLINHWSMNWIQFRDPLCYLCFAGAVVASWSLTQEVAGSNNLLQNIIIFVTEFSELSENI